MTEFHLLIPRDNAMTAVNPITLLSLTAEEKHIYAQLFEHADSEKIGVVMGPQAVPFFGKSKLSPKILGEIWQIADHADQGFLTKDEFYVALKLIALAQSGKPANVALISQGI